MQLGKCKFKMSTHEVCRWSYYLGLIFIMNMVTSCGSALFFNSHSFSSDSKKVNKPWRGIPDYRVQVFPLDTFPLLDYVSGGREFGAYRDGGYRLHAAADLVGNPGQPVYAITPGKIVDYYLFYQATRAIVIDHGAYVIRYGEIDYFWDASVRVGTKVHAAKKIAAIGRLKYGGGMLHIEQYAGNYDDENLTVMSNPPYFRRSDLMDVTPLLKSLERTFPQDVLTM